MFYHTIRTIARSFAFVAVLLVPSVAFAEPASPKSKQPQQFRQPVRSAGSIQFSVGAIQVNERDGFAVIQVERVGGSAGAVSITYACQNGTALDGSDYREKHGNLYWRDGDASTKTIRIPIVNNNASERIEFLKVGLVSPTDGARLGGFSSITVVIVDDDMGGASGR